MTVKKNVFTGGPLEDKIKTAFQHQRANGLALKMLHDGELEEYGEPHPYTGERSRRPKSTGAVYDIPPDNGTYTPNQVDLTGADAVNINKIMERVDPSGKQFAKAIAQGMVTDAGMTYDNFIGAPDFQEAQERFIHATQQFQMLPAKLRNRFNNNPSEFLEYVHNPETLEEQYTLGIRVKKVEPEKDATNKDVIKAIQETAKTQKKAPKGGDSGEE